jgi:Tfp pilus assembly protein PilO
MTDGVVRASVLAVLAIVGAGYVLLFRPLEASIATRHAELAAAHATLEQRLTLAARLPALEREERRVRRSVDRLHPGSARTETVERFLHTLAGIAARDGVIVQNIAAGGTQSDVRPARAAQDSLVEELPIELTLRGSYTSVIHAVRELDDGDVAARISLASLGNAGRRTDERPQLNAGFHVRLLREADATPTPRLQPR